MIIRFKLKTSIDIYTVIVKVDKYRETYEVDVYLGDPYFTDGTFKYLGEAQHINGYEDCEFTHTTAPIDDAKELIEEWERPIRLERYLAMKGYFIHMNEQPPKEEKPEIFDYEEIDEQNYVKYLMEHIEEVDRLDKKERKQLFKKYPDLKAKYQEWLWLEREAQ